MTDTPTNKPDLLARIRSARTALDAALAPLTPAQLAAQDRQGWSIKDHLAHLIRWERKLVGVNLGGQSFAEVFGMDAATAAATAHMSAETGINEWFHQQDQAMSLAEVQAAAAASFAATVAAIEELPAERLFGPHAAGSPDATLLDFIAGNTWEHYDEHREHLAAILQPND